MDVHKMTPSVSHPSRNSLPEKVAYWFFRLNGCLTIENFSVHPDGCGSQRTDVDVLAMRFPHRCELLTSGRPMTDHRVFTEVGIKVQIIFAEIKGVTCACSLNGPWTRPSDQNLQRVLYAVGAFPRLAVSKVAQSLYANRGYATDEMIVRLFAIGGRTSNETTVAPPVVQLNWEDVLQFIHSRMVNYRSEKADHRQWEGTGRQLYRSATRDFSKDAPGFTREWMEKMRPANRIPSG